MYQRTDTQGSLMLEKAIFLEDINSNMTSRDRKFKKMFNKPSILNNYVDTSTIGKLNNFKNKLLILLCIYFCYSMFVEILCKLFLT